MTITTRESEKLRYAPPQSARVAALGFDSGLGYVCPMNQVEEELLRVLLHLEESVRSVPTAQPKPNLLPLFERLDQLTAELPNGTDATLLHYLHKRSYQKARLWLQGREAENQAGNCRHV